MSVGRWLPPLLWAAGVLALTSIPNPELPGGHHLDKLGHFALYLGLGALTARALAPTLRRGRMALVVVAIALFAALDEAHQRLVPGRAASAADWTADVLGAGAGVLLFTTTALRRLESRS